MTARMCSPLVRIMPFLLAVCLPNLPLHAKYSGGSGTADDPYQIATAADLILLGESTGDYDKHFLLTGDIDLDPNLPGRRVLDGALIGYLPAESYPAGQETEGYPGTPFTGVLDGNSHEIRNLVIKAPWNSALGWNSVYVGLIAQIGETGQVKRLGLRNVSVGADLLGAVGSVAAENKGTISSCYVSGRVTGYYDIGGLVGCNQGGTIAACFSAGSVQGSSAGGLVGLNSGGMITSSHSSSSVVKNKHRGDIIDYAGGLVGENWNGTISSSYSSGDVAGDTTSGGLVGINDGTISSCYSGSNVIGGRAGGLVGKNSGGILSCYATGKVSGTRGVGGLVGEGWYGSIVTSYSTGMVTGTEYIGGLVGECVFTAVYFSYWAIETSGLKESAGGEGRTAEQMMSVETFAGWGRGTPWVLEDGKDFPHLTWEGHAGLPVTDPPDKYSGGGTGDPNDPYRLRTAEDLACIGRFPGDWNATFELADDIDMASADPNKLLPIGTTGLPFSGSFDGQGHAVRNFSGSAMQGGLTGVFGWLGPSATVQHLHLKDVTFSRGSIVGGLAAFNEGTILACSTTGRVAAGDRAGGLVGENRGMVALSCTRCDVSELGPAWIGGLVAANRGTVSSCYATGTVQGWCVGGLVGDNRDGIIIASYSTGPVKLKGPANNGGGLVSRIGFGAGSLLRGRSIPPDGGYGAVTASFWDTDTSGFSASSASGGTGLPTSKMQEAATFLNAGWDFIGETTNGTENIWWIDEGKDYPRLWWEVAAK